MITRITYDELTAEDHAAVKLWGERDDDELTYLDLDDAIEQYLDGRQEQDGMILMGGFVHTELTERSGPLDPHRIAEHILEALDEEYGNPNPVEEVWSPTERIMDAARALSDALHADYPVWSCEPIIYVEVPVRAWIEKHVPHWLKEEA